MDVADTAEEYLHEPMDRRLWNESYYFDFTGDSIRGFTRLGFQPYERRANVWCYLVYDGQAYWYRDEQIPLEGCFGLLAETDAYTQQYRILEPHERWALTAGGQLSTSASSWEVLLGAEESVRGDISLTFERPHHEPYSIDMLVDTQDHYDQTGHYEGTIELDGEEVTVDGEGFRDHSWGWFRDWTPGKWGHFTGTLQFDTGEAIVLVAQIQPDGDVRNSFGYRAGKESVEPVRDAAVSCDDGLERDERGRAWAEGDYPDTITYKPDFGDGPETIHCTPRFNLPIGYEDRNWELSDPDGPWLQGVLNRMPVDCEWEGKQGHGWIEATHPFL